MSCHENEVLQEYRYENIEMQCYCEKCECKNMINYVHHHNWGRSEDYMCSNCLDNCEEN